MNHNTSSNPAVFVLSLDTELAWGNFERVKDPLKKTQMFRTRYCIQQLLDLLETYNIRATWAVVGHLMLDACHPDENGVKHPQAIRPAYSWHPGDWFEDDPCTSLQENPLWYGMDIVNKIRSCTVPQEIASHSFAHQIFGDPGCHWACADTDIRLAVYAAQALNIQMDSFVYPKNSIAHQTVLAKYGFRIYRGEGTEWYHRFRHPLLRKILHFLDDLLAVPPAADTLHRDNDNLFYTNGNMMYQSMEGLRKLIPLRARVRKAKMGINKAVAQGKIFHLWLHPFNLASDPTRLLAGLEEIFKHVKNLEDAGRLVNLPMRELPAFFGVKPDPTDVLINEGTANYIR